MESGVSAPSTREWLRTAADRVSVGSGRLAVRSVGRLVRAAQAAFSRLPWWAQLLAAYVALLKGPPAIAGLGGRVHERVESGAWTGVLTVSALLWLVVAYRVGRDEPEPATVETDQPDEGAETEEPAPAMPATSRPGAPPVSPVALVAAVRDIGTPHAQLVPLAEHLGTTTDAVRAAAQRMAWAVKDVRMEGRSSTAGLRWDDCPSPTILAPSSAVVGAGQPADDDNDDTEEGDGEKRFRVVPLGSEGVIVYDSADTIRHHQVRGH